MNDFENMNNTQQPTQPEQPNPYGQPAQTEQPSPYEQPAGPVQNEVYTPQVLETPAPKKGMGFAIASMCCGICSIVFCCAWYLSLPAAIVAIVLGILNLVKHGAGRGMALAGVICGGVGLLLSLSTAACICTTYGSLDALMNDLIGYNYYY